MMSNKQLYWNDIKTWINDGTIDLNSRVVVMDNEGNEHFRKLNWIEEIGFERPLLIIKEED